MVQVPAATSVTVEPETVQVDVVCELKLTGRFEDAVALTVKVPDPKAWFANDAKLMV
jgi:hypothetical protein